MPNILELQLKAGGPGEMISPLAGKPAPKEMLINVDRLEKEYFERCPDLSDPNQLVAFGTSGHRGSPLHGTFTEAHILAITQAICGYRREQGTDGPLYMGKDTHALSGPAQHIVLAANAESFKSQSHLDAIVSEAQEMVNNALGSTGGVSQAGARH